MKQFIANDHTLKEHIMIDVHRSAQDGFSKSSAAYDKGRPSYPSQLNDWLTQSGICAGKTVVDLGAGTGKFTKYLVEAGADVIAVEPVGPMLGKLSEAFPSVDAREGSATQIPMDDESVDAVFCAQAFHWFASTEALAEIRRVLKPNGVLGLVWNVRDETKDWVAELSRIMAPYEANTPRFHEGQWRLVFPADGFVELQEGTFQHEHRGNFQNVVVDRIMSVSFIAALPLKEQKNVERQIRELVGVYPELANESDVKFPYQTLVAWTRKLT